eukprot:6801355-Prymnesium_polylepis.1
MGVLLTSAQAPRRAARRPLTTLSPLRHAAPHATPPRRTARTAAPCRAPRGATPPRAARCAPFPRNACEDRMGGWGAA